MVTVKTGRGRQQSARGQNGESGCNVVALTGFNLDKKKRGREGEYWVSNDSLPTPRMCKLLIGVYLPCSHAMPLKAMSIVSRLNPLCV